MLAERLWRVVERYPDTVAINDARRGAISYAQLWHSIQATSAKLEEQFRDEKYIGVIADQDAHAVIVCIAIILSGKVVVPVDPRYDTGLVEHMLKPFTTKIICGVDKQFNAPFTALPLRAVISHDGIERELARENTNAYVLHTSGTTGRPKAVLADQSALLQVACALTKRYHIATGSKVLQFAYLSFDSSLVEIWSTLFGGGTIVIAGGKLREDLYGCLEELLGKHWITVATLPSAVAHNVPDRYLRNLETLVLAGDECPAELANRLHSLHIPHLINAYGPTESIICATTYEICEKQSDRVPIGTPLPGMKITIEDPDERGRGELMLASSYLAKGYPNDALQTKRSFSTGSHGELCYKTGDIGMLRADGQYEFFGRIDNQVKINGQRVELEGVEARIRNLSKRSEIVVLAVSNTLYCLYRSDEALPIFKDIEVKLRGDLPVYAVPQRYIPVKEMKLDFNGKLDRGALKQLILDKQHVGRNDGHRRHDDTSSMIALWAKLLGISQNKVAEDCSFFSLGGDSLSALKLVKAINDQYSVSLRLSEVVAAPASPTSMLAAVEKHRVGG